MDNKMEHFINTKTKKELRLLFRKSTIQLLEELYPETDAPSFSIFVEKLVCFGIQELKHGGEV